VLISPRVIQQVLDFKPIAAYQAAICLPLPFIYLLSLSPSYLSLLLCCQTLLFINGWFLNNSTSMCKPSTTVRIVLFDVDVSLQQGFMCKFLCFTGFTVSSLARHWRNLEATAPLWMRWSSHQMVTAYWGQLCSSQFSLILGKVPSVLLWAVYEFYISSTYLSWMAYHLQLWHHILLIHTKNINLFDLYSGGTHPTWVFVMAPAIQAGLLPQTPLPNAGTLP
jgi:hypothetical protein